MKKDASRIISSEAGNNKRKKVAGVVMASLYDPYQQEIYEGIKSCVDESGLKFLFFIGGALQHPEEIYSFRNPLYDLINADTLDILMLISGPLSGYGGTDVLQQFINRYPDIPALSISLALPGIPSIVMDNYPGMYKVISHLITVHHCKHIAFIKGPDGNGEADERFAAYKDCLAHYGLSYDENYIYRGYFWANDGEQAIKCFLDERKIHFDALVCSDDQAAINAVKELKRRNINVPQQVKVTGFDNIRMSNYTNPGLTTVNQPLFQLGAKSVHTAWNILHNRPVPPLETLDTTCVLRQSCGCPITPPDLINDKSKSSPPTENECCPAASTTGIDNLRICIQQLLRVTTTDTTENDKQTAMSDLMRLLADVRNKNSQVPLWSTLLSMIIKEITVKDHNGTLHDLHRHLNDFFKIAYRLETQINSERESQLLSKEEFNYLLHAIGEKIMMSYELEKLKATLYKKFPMIGIKNSLISLYEEDNTNSKLIFYLGFDENKAEPDLIYPSGDLFPAPIDTYKPDIFIIVPLFIEKKQLGYIIFAAGEIPSIFYEFLGDKISRCFSGIEMIETINNHRIELEQQVKERTKELEEAHKQKSAYFTNLAHETRTPLTIISNYLDHYIKQTGASRESRIIMQNFEKLKNDMINFLDAGKIERGQTFYDHDQICNLSMLMQEKIELFSQTAAIKSININTEVTNDLYIKADPAAMDRIINNLLSNAFKFTRKNGIITVSLSAVPRSLIIKITDTGIGIPETEITHIFSPYYQISSKKRNIQGVGMGLFITKMIIDSLKGRIEVVSKVEQGTTFTIFLNRHILKKSDRITNTPRLSKPVQTDMIIVDDLKEKKPDLLKETILIAEDNRELLAYIKNNLDTDYNIFWGSNGIEALEKLKTIPKPGLILSDIMMDGMDGYEFFNHVSRMEEYREIPFIFLTARNSLLEKIKGFEKGAIDYIYKPFYIDELRARIDTIIKNRQLTKALHEKDKFSTLDMLTSGISHEILNPLQLIYNPLTLLENEVGKLAIDNKDKILGYVSRINDNVERIEKIIKSMKLLTYQADLNKDPIDLARIIKGIKKLYHTKIKDRITITTKIAENLNLIGDEDALGHVLTNLVGNAIDAIKDTGEIIITAHYANNTNTITVKDTGKGIPKQALPRIFDAFYTGKKVGKGLGLGLYIVKDLLLKMNWTITVDSIPGEGTEFIITAGVEKKLPLIDKPDKNNDD